ncbi:hypothetical protein THAOC_13373 [Thalassiosira oceanica]|uniref:Uncharacterized protein n=1 Tax=Thalassiosira oceanica TaxID=159749 RepID=K0SXM1_THAOC|nr:hypothetical protein THAOC_13373 [Thalassiosira oceanica]|eukprot:EJK65741.1 hypothetical protein THAOC_13373 [Thalassiosira oceanica]
MASTTNSGTNTGGGSGAAAGGGGGAAAGGGSGAAAGGGAGVTQSSSTASTTTNNMTEDALKTIFIADPTLYKVQSFSGTSQFTKADAFAAKCTPVNDTGGGAANQQEGSESLKALTAKVDDLTTALSKMAALNKKVADLEAKETESPERARQYEMLSKAWDPLK